MPAAAVGRRLLGAAASGPEWLDSRTSPTADSASGLEDPDSSDPTPGTLPPLPDLPISRQISLATTPVADSLDLNDPVTPTVSRLACISLRSFWLWRHLSTAC